MSKKYEGKYIVRCDRAGVFYGEIEGVDGNVVSMRKVRKLWMWSGALLWSIWQRRARAIRKAAGLQL